MGKLYDKLMEDYRFKEGLNACINCGTCTAICPAAEFYKYDPRSITDIVQSKDDDEIEALLKSETIWYCGQCMSCVTRCPRKNAPGFIIQALRNLLGHENIETTMVYLQIAQLSTQKLFSPLDTLFSEFGKK